MESLLFLCLKDGLADVKLDVCSLRSCVDRYVLYTLQIPCHLLLEHNADYFWQKDQIPPARRCMKLFPLEFLTSISTKTNNLGYPNVYILMKPNNKPIKTIHHCCPSKNLLVISSLTHSSILPLTSPTKRSYVSLTKNNPQCAPTSSTPSIYILTHVGSRS